MIFSVMLQTIIMALMMITGGEVPFLLIGMLARVTFSGGWKHLIIVH